MLSARGHRRSSGKEARHVEWAEKLGELHQINKNAPPNHTTRLAVVHTGIPPSRTLSSWAEISDITGYTQTISRILLPRAACRGQLNRIKLTDVPYTFPQAILGCAEQAARVISPFGDIPKL
jgi:hypothetical protein